MRDISPSSQKALREIPSVTEFLEKIEKFLANTSPYTNQNDIKTFIRIRLDLLRKDFIKHPPITYPSKTEIIQTLQEEIVKSIQQKRLPKLRPVINATGVILHTNLGRAPLAPEAVKAIIDIASDYSNLEFDLTNGKRGQRNSHCEDLLTEILDCESAVVVNNCAAAVLITLSTLCQDSEVIISRGELIEIGGGFRIPDVMRQSGTILREVGTTNRTHIFDYEQAITSKTKMIVRVHPSNFRLIGFTTSPNVKELATLAKRYGLIYYEDLGSGALVDLSVYGVDEPLPQKLLADGADIVTFSGDKLLGGPQSGIIAGKKTFIDQICKHPLMRALRVDKITYAALESTLRLYLEDEILNKIPILSIISLSVEEITTRVKKFSKGLKQKLAKLNIHCSISLHPGYSVIGGGTSPDTKLSTVLIGISSPIHSSSELNKILRQLSPPIISRIENDLLILDLRTVLPNQEKTLSDALVKIIAST